MLIRTSVPAETYCSFELPWF